MIIFGTTLGDFIWSTIAILYMIGMIWMGFWFIASVSLSYSVGHLVSFDLSESHLTGFSWERLGVWFGKLLLCAFGITLTMLTVETLVWVAATLKPDLF